MGFINLSFIDIIDIISVTFILYYVYRLIRGTNAINIFAALILVYILYLVVRAFKMELMTVILGQFIGVGVLAIIILFQQEIRRFLLHIGTNYMGRRSGNSLFAKWFKVDKEVDIDKFKEIADACKYMSENKVGALIVIGVTSPLVMYAHTGNILDAEISTRLLLNIFFKNSPLHDGAVIITNGRIDAAACILPSSENINLPSFYGMRHRAAIGITEVTDAAAIVVSEETGRISVSKNGKIENNINLERLEQFITNI